MSVREGGGANKLGTHVASQPPNYLITTASSWFGGRKKQREVIRDFEAVRLQSHTAVGIIFNKAGMFLALSKNYCGHSPKRVTACASSLLVHFLKIKTLRPAAAILRRRLRPARRRR
jgi:hypothetical protein